MSFSQGAVLRGNAVGGGLLLQLLPHLDCCNQLIFSHEFVNYCRHFLAVNPLSSPLPDTIILPQQLKPPNFSLRLWTKQTKLPEVPEIIKLINHLYL